MGVKAVTGEFSRGAVVAIADLNDQIIGIGVSNFSSVELREIMGIRSDAISAKAGIRANRVADNDMVVVGKRFARMREIAPTPSEATPFSCNAGYAAHERIVRNNRANRSRLWLQGKRPIQFGRLFSTYLVPIYARL